MIKDDIANMEHLLFVLRAGDRRIRVCERNKVTVTVKPGPDEWATIYAGLTDFSEAARETLHNLDISRSLWDS